MSYPLKIALVLVTTIGFAAGSALAAGKPKGAKPTSPDVIWKLYAGKTSHWNSGGFAYWGPDGTYRGISKTGEWFGEGKWYVTTRGRMCHESAWQKAEAGSTKSDPDKWCWEFVTAPDGQVWERFIPDKTDWYRHNPAKQHGGETQRSRFRTMKTAAGN